MAENRNEQSELERLRREQAAQSAELARLRREKQEAEKAAEQAKAEADAISRKVDEEVMRTERDAVRQLHAQRKVRLLIPSGRDPHERAPVPVAVNGREFLIVRDKEVVVPEGVLNVLKLAREKVAVSTEQNGQQVVSWEEAQRIPFQVLGYVEPSAANVEV